jgi:DMSO/TMAO reductase YedYZ heme-binding membrane subunit
MPATVKTPVVLKNTLLEWAVSLCTGGASVLFLMFLFKLRDRPYSMYSFNKASALTGVVLVLAAIGLGTLCRVLSLKRAARFRRPLGILAAILITTHAFLSAFNFPDRYDWSYYIKNWEALLYGFLALIGFLLLWLTSYTFAHRRMGSTAWNRMQTSVYILLALACLHFCHLGKPLCWLTWLEGESPQHRVPPLSLILFLGMVLIIVIRLLEPLLRGNGREQSSS